MHVKSPEKNIESETLVTLETPLIQSGFMQTVEAGKNTVIWHSLFGKPKIISREMQEFLGIFSSPKTLRAIYDEYELSQDEIAYIQELIADHYLILDGFDERAFLAQKMRERERQITDGSLIKYLELIMSEVCNFRCTYCMHFNNLETSDRITNPHKLMDFNTAKKAVDGFLQILRKHKNNAAEINFGGGEPLLAWPVIRQVLEYCRLAYDNQFDFRFFINTNASLMTAEIARELKSHRVEVASSLDGTREGNDKVRLTKSGGGTFASIIKGFDTLAAQDYPLNGIAVTINECNFSDLNENIIDWAKARGMREVRIDIDVIGMVEIPLADIVAKLMRIRRYAHKSGIDVAGFWSRPAENLNDSTLEANVAFCGAVRGNSMCISPSGNIYGCGYSTTKLGSLDKIESFCAQGGAYHHFVKDHLTGAMNACKGCMIEGQCGGGCNITQEYARAMQTTKIDRMCDFWRQMTRTLLSEQLHENKF
ncbi:radical SAM protein [Candidatus Peregrinibacteria bacterium]|nr:radical SAM protein [Candidatus Peregrinibacteria bacterium]